MTFSSSSKWRRNNPQKYLHYQAKRRALKSGVYFNIEPEDIVFPEFCPVFGIPLQIREYDGKSCSTDNSPTIDRIDHTKGYTKDNIMVISNKANRIKSDGTILEHLLVILYILKHKLLRPQEYGH